MSEDEVVVAFADWLRGESWLVLAEGANQGAAFRYMVDTVIKAPDIVALRDGVLLIGEGKLRARDLMVAGSRGISDFDALRQLSADESEKLNLAREAARRCHASELTCPDAEAIHVRTVLFAHHASESEAIEAEAAALLFHVIR